jgi:hypothetical protein
VIHPPRNILNATLLALLVALALAAFATSAASAKTKQPAPCWKQLINDWYDGRIDGTYPIHCYREALKHLPTDVDTYSSARDDIKQALQERITQGRKRGDGGGSTSGGGGSTSGGGGSTSGGGGSTSGGGGSGISGGGSNGSGGSGSQSASGGPIGDVFDKTKPGSADSVPVPLIVLGAVALFLMAAGAAGFMARRMRTRKLQLASLPQAPSEPRQPKR